jgi:hypothetical protein
VIAARVIQGTVIDGTTVALSLARRTKMESERGSFGIAMDSAFSSFL